MLSLFSLREGGLAMGRGCGVLGMLVLIIIFILSPKTTSILYKAGYKFIHPDARFRFCILLTFKFLEA